MVRIISTAGLGAAIEDRSVDGIPYEKEAADELPASEQKPKEPRKEVIRGYRRELKPVEARAIEATPTKLDSGESILDN